MTVSPINANPDDNNTTVSPPPSAPAADGIYALPVVGPQLRRVRKIADGLQPTADDNTGQVAAKRVVQGAVIVGSAGILAIAVL